MENNPPKGRGLHPVMSFRHHGRSSAWIALLVVLLALPLIWVKGKSQYMTEAVFQVSPSYQKNLSADKELELQSNSQYREFVNHLSRSVLRYDVLEDALLRLRKAGIEPRLPAENDRKCIERLQRAIYVLPVADTYMVRVGLRSDQREHLDDIVNAIMDAFLENTRNEQIYGSDERSLVLQERTRAVRAEVAGFEQERAELAGKLGLTTFGENTANPYDAILVQAREKLTLGAIERSHAQATLDAFSSQQEVPASAGRSLLEMRLQDSGLQALRNEVIKRSEELSRVMAGVEERHPARAPAAAEQAEINNRLQSRENAFEKSAQQNIRSRLMASVVQTRQVEKELLERVQSLEGQASTFAADFRSAVRISGDIRKREVELEDMRGRLNYMGTERNAIGFVRLISRALPADTPQGIGKTKLLSGLLFAGLALTLLLPMVFDMLDRRVLAVGDAERALGIRSAAWWVEINDEASRILARDQSRRFASTLLRNKARGARGVFGFTSVKVGGGSTALVMDVASTLKQLGSRVLVIDANSLSHHSPMAHTGPGLTDLLDERASPDDVISNQEHMGQMLSVVSFGHAPERGIQRMDILRDAITQWSLDYDLVLLDIPPILPSADAELLIDAIGQVFLVVQANAATKGEVVRARAQLEKMAPDALGLVVNRVPMELGGQELKAQMVETITGGRFSTFMSMPSLRLHLEMMRVRWSRKRFWFRR